MTSADNVFQKIIFAKKLCLSKENVWQKLLIDKRYHLPKYNADNVCQKIMFALGRGRSCFCTSGLTLNGLCHFKFIWRPLTFRLNVNWNVSYQKCLQKLRATLTCRYLGERRGVAGLLPAAFLQVMVVLSPQCISHWFPPILQSSQKSYHGCLWDITKRFWEGEGRRRLEQWQQGSESSQN